MELPQVLFVEDCDFESFPAGGQLAMARSLIKVFGDRWALVGLGGPDARIGQWSRRTIGGATYSFLPVCRSSARAQRPLMPARLSFYLGLRRFRDEILSSRCKCVFTQSSEALLALSSWGMKNVCFMFPGVENPVRISRYAFVRKAWPLFDTLFFSALRKADLVVACADEEAIENLVRQSRGRISLERIVRLPTCVDTEEFRPMPMEHVRRDLGIPAGAKVVAACGRIAAIKGWDLLLKAFASLQNRCPDAMLVFVGDGEDRPRLEAAIAASRLGSFVRITGFQKHNQIARYLNAADVVACASHAEGWSVAMLEALACGKPLVSTNVSGVRAMVVPGQNGFVVPSRDPAEYAKALEDALRLNGVEAVSRGIADQFSTTWLGVQLRQRWQPLRAEPVVIEKQDSAVHSVMSGIIPQI